MFDTSIGTIITKRSLKPSTNLSSDVMSFPVLTKVILLWNCLIIRDLINWLPDFSIISAAMLPWGTGIIWSTEFAIFSVDVWIFSSFSVNFWISKKLQVRVLYHFRSRFWDFSSWNEHCLVGKARLWAIFIKCLG